MGQRKLDITAEAAIESLKEAANNGTLTENHKGRIAELLSTNVRTELSSTIKESTDTKSIVDKLISKGRIKLVTFNTPVDYEMPLVKSISAGNYAWVDEWVTSGEIPYECRANPTQEVALQLVQFPHWEMYDFNVLSQFEKLGLRAANLAELLALGAAHPQLQEEFSIVALGSKKCSRWGSPRTRFYPTLTKRDVYGPWIETGPGESIAHKIGIERIVNIVYYDVFKTGPSRRFLAAPE